MHASIGGILLALTVLPVLLAAVAIAGVMTLLGVVVLGDLVGGAIYFCLQAGYRRIFLPMRGLFGLTVLALLVTFGALSGCAELKVIATDATTAFDTAAGAANAAVTAYGVIKGIAGIAVLADPALAVVVTPAEAVLDPLVSKLKAEIADSSTDVSTIVADTQALTSQANTLASETASAIHVVPNATTTVVTPTSISAPREVFAR